MTSGSTFTYAHSGTSVRCAVRKVFDHLGVTPSDKPAPPPPLRKQASEWSVDLERRYPLEPVRF